MTNLTKYGFLLILSFVLTACGGSDGSKTGYTFSSFASSSAASSAPAVVAETLTKICIDNATTAYAGPKIWWWGAADGLIADSTGWPGPDMVEEGDTNVYCYDFAEDLTSGNTMPATMNVLITDNGSDSARTGDLAFTNDLGCYQDGEWVKLADCGVIAPVEARICFDKMSTTDNASNSASGWTQANLYFWSPAPGDSLDPASNSWPGYAMAQNGDFFCYNFAEDLTENSMPTSMNVIFNNGAAQTADLSFTSAGGACYQNDAWTTLEACGVDSQD